LARYREVDGAATRQGRAGGQVPILLKTLDKKHNEGALTESFVIAIYPCDVYIQLNVSYMQIHIF
jgi:hypothetical protein